MPNLVEMPSGILALLSGEDFVLVVHQHQFVSRGAVRGTLDLSSQVGIVAGTDCRRPITRREPRKQDRWRLPRERCYAYRARIDAEY